MSRGRFGEVGDLIVTGKSPTYIRGSQGDVSRSQTMATCRDGLKNPRQFSDKSVCVVLMEIGNDQHDTTRQTDFRTGTESDRQLPWQYRTLRSIAR